MSAVSIATEVPAPIAMPRSAEASAGASLTPSPTVRSWQARRHARRRRRARAFRDAGGHLLIRALLVDHHQIVRSGVRRLLEANGAIEIVGEASGVRDALDQARALRPDVVVLDLTLRDGSGLDVLADLRKLGARVVILSMRDEPAYARKGFRARRAGLRRQGCGRRRARERDRHRARRPHLRPSSARRAPRPA